jgi:hypothetical protein
VFHQSFPGPLPERNFRGQTNNLFQQLICGSTLLDTTGEGLTLILDTLLVSCVEEERNKEKKIGRKEENDRRKDIRNRCKERKIRRIEGEMQK